ncbi:MAG: S10 family peptidase [Gemmatimonas sp.]
MRDRVRALLLLGILALASALASGAAAQAPARQPRGGAQTATEPAAEAASEQRPRPRDALLPAESVTKHTITIAGRALNYTARAGALTLTGEDGDATAEVFYVAYALADAPATRPLTIAFNGGPGASSAYLHLGALGPRAIDLGDGRSPPGGQEPKVVDNPDTWLPFTDLLFIDPVGTGYSHAMRDVKDVPKEFWGVRQDIDSLAQIIRRALVRLDRVGAPLYLVGESYGGFRGARLVERLPANEGIPVQGAILVSPVLEFALRSSDDLDPLPWALRLPSYAAANLEAHGRLAPEALADAERFALGDYVAHLIAPRDAQGTAEINARVATLTGLSQAIVARWNARVPSGVFAKEFRHDEGRVASAYDASVLGEDAYPSSATPRGGDPIFAGVIAPLTTAFLDYVRGELQYRTDRRYRLLNDEVARRWDWGRSSASSSAGAVDELRQGLALNPRLKIAIEHGMTDIVTPYMASRYVIDHLPPALTKDRVSLHLYPGGHMMYFRPDSRAAFRRNAAAMYGE